MAEHRDPRAEASRSRILLATRRLVTEAGPEEVTFARIAEVSGVARATVYRHWAELDDLLGEVLDEFSLPFFGRPEEPLDCWLRAQLRRLADELATPTVARLVAALLQHAASGDDRARDRRDRLFTTLEDRLAAVLAPARRSDSADAAADIIGPLLYRGLMLGRRTPDAQIDALVTRALGAGVSAASGSDPCTAAS